MVLDNGTTVYVARDEEGNDAGALHGVSRTGEEFVLPEILSKTKILAKPSRKSLRESLN